MFVTTVAFVALMGVTSAPPAAAASPEVDELHTLVNNYRAANGVGPLRKCSNLMNAAQGHAADMAARNYFSHTSPEGTTFTMRDNAAGYTGWTVLGENIAKSFATPIATLNGWIASPTHRANMLDGAYTDTGLGVAYTAGGTPYWVQEFGAGGKCGSSVVGGFDGVTSSWPQTGRVRGWAFDSQSPGTVLNIDVYVDGKMIGRYPASLSRPDVGNAFPSAGPNHGFDVTFTSTAGFHDVCVHVNSLTPGVYPLLGCQTIALASGDPVGNLDVADSPSPGMARVYGWTFDPETASPIGVHVYIDGKFAAAATAGNARGDIGVTFPAYGPNHGFDVRVPVATGGAHQACVYGINAFLGNNRLIGCRTIQVTDPSPSGNLDGVDITSPRTVSVRGWALDRDTTAPIDVDIYVDGVKAGRFNAAAFRGDIAAAFPAFGGNHGYAVPLTLTTGSHTVCAYGINVGNIGTNTTLGCKSVFLSSDPFGSFDAAGATRGVLTGNGWAIDPDSVNPIGVHVYVDGVFRVAVTANTTRTDVGAVFPFFGSSHGYAFSVPVSPGSRQVCTYSINVGAGSNRLIMCRNVMA